MLLVTIYMSFIYGLLYLSLTAYGLIFEEVYGFSLGVAGLPVSDPELIGVNLEDIMNSNFLSSTLA